MQTEGVNIGEAIRELRKKQNITKEHLAEKAGISVSHLEKIESGGRRPGMDTYQRLLKLLNADMVIRKEMETVQEKCAAAVRQILLNSTETQAIFMTHILETMAESMDTVIQ